MFSPSTLHDLVSGRTRGFTAAMFRSVAGYLEIPVRWYVNRVNRSFEEHRADVYHIPAKVLSVGNLTVGGTGKSPCVEWLARWLRDEARTPLLISRGYGSRANSANDEALELAAKLPGILHWQNANRVAAAKEAFASFPQGVIVLDDAFQHRRLHRDLDIVLLDALAPFGYEHLLPRGLLREPLENLQRAQIVILSRADLVNDGTRQTIRERVAKLAPQAIFAEARHEPRELINARGERASLEILRGKQIGAFCGIGNPEGFRRTLAECDCRIAIWREFADHYAYTDRDCHHLVAEFATQPIPLAICTMKDLVKIPPAKWNGIPLWAMSIGWRFISGEAEVVEKLRATIM